VPLDPYRLRAGPPRARRRSAGRTNRHGALHDRPRIVEHELAEPDRVPRREEPARAGGL